MDSPEQFDILYQQNVTRKSPKKHKQNAFIITSVNALFPNPNPTSNPNP